jgi:triphosphoribosyl-dephospho-CoA synthetase
LQILLLLVAVNNDTNLVSRGGFAAYADLLAVTIFLSRFPTAVEQAMKPLLSLCAADRIYHV